MEDRRQREALEKEHNDEQAKIWETDRRLQMERDQQVHEKVKKINLDTAQYLKQ